jgi:hypothetical protein
LDDAVTIKIRLFCGFQVFSSQKPHPLFGPLGTIMGRTIPTPPQKTVNTMKGTAAAPIMLRNTEKWDKYENL